MVVDYWMSHESQVYSYLMGPACQRYTPHQAADVSAWTLVSGQFVKDSRALFSWRKHLSCSVTFLRINSNVVMVVKKIVWPIHPYLEPVQWLVAENPLGWGVRKMTVNQGQVLFWVVFGKVVDIFGKICTRALKPNLDIEFTKALCTCMHFKTR